MTGRICARTGCDKPVRTQPPKTMPKHMRAAFLAELVNDPFCSTECCRAAHGVPLEKSSASSAAPFARQMPPCGTTAAYFAGCLCDRCRDAERVKQRERRANKTDAQRAAANAKTRERRARKRAEKRKEAA